MERQMLEYTKYTTYIVVAQGDTLGLESLQGHVIDNRSKTNVYKIT